MKTIRPIFLAAALLCGCAPEPAGTRPPAAVEEAAAPAVLAIRNAVIHTADRGRPRAAAMAFTAAGEILALGDDEEVLAAWPAADSRDLGGRTVIPGLIDSHGHLDNLAVSLGQAQLMGTSSRAEVIERLKSWARNLDGDDWLLGRGWDQNDWPEREFPSRADLDEHFPERPVWLRRIDGHAGWANSAALARADRDLGGDWQPAGGYIHRDAAGHATGVLIDGAMDLVDSLVAPPSEQLMEQVLGLALRRLSSLGLTGVHDPGIGRGVVERYLRWIGAGKFPVRVYAMADGAGATLDWLCQRGAIEHESGRLLMRSVKLYADGALGSRGAALLQDYHDQPGNDGLLFLRQAELERQIAKVLSCGFQAAVHAIGDRANRVVLDALEEVMPQFPENPGRHRIEHAQVLAATDVTRFGSLGVIAAMQPTHATSDMYWAGDRLGPRRVRHAYAWRSLLDSGARLAFGSDFPVEEANPMLGLFAAVTRQDPEGWPEGGWQPRERVTREEALRGFTLDAAYAGFMDHMVGSLQPGKRADFVVLDRDIMTVPVTEIPATRVLETWLDGQRVYPDSEHR